MKPNPNWRGDPTFLPDVLRHWGVSFRELPGWDKWGMGDFNVIQGVMWHHTGARNTSAAYIARNAGLSGALSSQFHTDPKGLQTLCGVGIAYHAGRGSKTGWPTNNANWSSIGFEMQHNGTDPWPEEQLDSTRRATAAILWFLGKRATLTTMISHWEYSLIVQGKWDPGSGKGFAPRWQKDWEAMMNMDHQRNLVNQLIDNPPGSTPPRLPTTGSSSIQEDANVLFKQITDFIKGFVGPIISDVKDMRQQLTGGRDAGEYPGWAQLGKNAAGQNLTLVDGVAATRLDIARLESKLDQIIGGKN